jgi:hypothetical protein
MPPSSVFSRFGAAAGVSKQDLERLESMAAVMPAAGAKPLRSAIDDYAAVLALHRGARAQLDLAGQTMEAATEAATEHILTNAGRGARSLEAATTEHLKALAALERAKAAEALTRLAVPRAAARLKGHRWGPTGFIWCATQRALAGL